MTTTIVLVGLMVACLVAISFNLAATWTARRAARRTHTTVQLIAENGDGDQYPVATLHRVTQWGDPVELAWQNPSSVPVHIIGWYAAWDWPVGGLNGDMTEHHDVVIEPGGVVVFQASVRSPDA